MTFILLDVTIFLGFFYFLVFVSEPFRFYLKVAFAGFLIGFSSYISLLCLIFADQSAQRRFAARSGKLIGALLGLSFEFINADTLADGKGGIILVNHQCFLDYFVLAHIWTYIGDGNVVVRFKRLLYGLTLLPAYLAGIIFIYQERKNKVIEKINREAKKVLGKNGKLVFFPEGTRNMSEDLKQFKKGAFMVAIDHQCPIYPVIVQPMDNYNVKKKVFDKATYFVHALPPIPTTDLTKVDLPLLIERTYSLMQNEYKKLSQEAALRIKSKTQMKLLN